MHIITPNVKSPHVIIFIRKHLKCNNAIEIVITPREGAEPLDCFNNVRRIVAQNGGEIVFGWSIWEWPNVFIEAEHHAVWRDTNGKLVDVTPSQNGHVKRVFVPDPSAIYDFDNEGIQRYNIRESLANDENILKYFRLAEYKDRLMNSIPGTGDVEFPIEVANQLKMIAFEGAELMLAIGMKHTLPNSLCFCGSGLEFKKCHGK